MHGDLGHQPRRPPGCRLVDILSFVGSSWNRPSWRRSRRASASSLQPVFVIWPRRSLCRPPTPAPSTKCLLAKEMEVEVLLGLPGPWSGDYREKADHYTTKIGGVPDWPIQDMGIKPDLLQCSLCGAKLCLVTQVYAPVAKLNIEERVIYVLACPTPECGPNPRSWKALRVQKCDSGMQTGDNGNKLNRRKEDVCSNELSKSFSEEHNDENRGHEDKDDDFDLDELAKALEQAATLASNSKKKNKPKCVTAPIKCPVVKERMNNPVVPVLPCFYIYCDKEQSGGKGTVGPSSTQPILVEEILDTADDQEDNWEGENYEYDSALGADRTFLKFKKRLDAYPEQCFRYSYGGTPLPAATNLQEPGTCKLCGAARQYELQLMPPLLYFLHTAGDTSSNYAPEGWAWLTLIIYTCFNSCCPSSCGGKSGSCCWGIAEEAIVIQED